MKPTRGLSPGPLRYNDGLKSGSSSAVERELPKLDVAGSIPVSRSNLRSAPSTRCRILLVIAQFAVAWAYVISITGGFVVELGPLRVSSRNANNPLLLALLAIGAAWILAPAGRRGGTMLAESTWLASALNRVVAPWIPFRQRWRATIVAALLAGAVTSFGVFRGAFVGGASDSYGYVSQAHLWLSGTLRVPLPEVGELPSGVPANVFVPLGYRLAPDRASIVPTYSPGFPLQMAIFERVFGPGAMFYVMPLLAGVAVWTTYLLGTLLVGSAAGLIAALLLATSPAFVFMLTHAPMSDIPAMAWWTVALVVLLRSSRTSALAAGVATGAAILTRPNLVPVTLVPVAFLVWEVAARRVLPRRLAIQRLLLFVIGSVPACLMVAYLNNYWYGSPLTSGYGSFEELYSWEFLWPNVTDYSRRLLDSQGPLVLVAAAAPAFLWRNWGHKEGPMRTRSSLVLIAAFAVAVCLCYASYVPLDTWWTLRFLLPAFPILFVFLSVALLGIPARLPPQARGPMVLILVGVIMSHVIVFGCDNSVFDSSDEQRYAEVGRYIAQELPDRAVLFAVLHSGSARHYSGRLTVRYDFIAPELLEATIEHFRTRGFIPYFVLDAGERREFVERFSQTTRLGKLDWQPVAVVHAVALYEPADAPLRALR